MEQTNTGINFPARQTAATDWLLMEELVVYGLVPEMLARLRCAEDSIIHLKAISPLVLLSFIIDRRHHRHRDGCHRRYAI